MEIKGGVNSGLKVFTGIKELMTLKDAAAKDGRYITEHDLGVIKDGAIIARESNILWVGQKKNLHRALRDLTEFVVKKTAAESVAKNVTDESVVKNIAKRRVRVKPKITEISLKAECVMPAFVECHTHLIFAGDRQNEFEMRNQGMSYQEIAQKGGGILSTVKQTQKASEKELLRLAEERAKNFVRQGVATIEVKSGYGLTEEAELKILKVAKKIRSARVVSTYLGPHAIPKDKSVEKYLREIQSSTLHKIKRQNLADRIDMFIEKGYFSLDQAKTYYRIAKSLEFRLTGHVEQLSHTGASQCLTELDADSVDHVVEISDADIAQIAKSQTTAVLLPASDFYLKMNYPPARKLIDMGARVAIATDFNPGSSPTQDLSLVGVLSRLQMNMTLPEVIAAYTIGAAHALNLQDSLGSIEIGKQCDFIVIDGSWRELFYQIGFHPIREVFRAGCQQNLKKS
ncbi:MAG: imidazolonepropionase [Bdellovibrionales bacterium RBG_16_40_8]|nr:MAG: imidazolonepropionase [Bdellovibrionales bacterium RBG_16_40_8]